MCECVSELISRFAFLPAPNMPTRYQRPQSAKPAGRGRAGASRPRSAPLDTVDDTYEDGEYEAVDGLPPGDDLPPMDEDDNEDDDEEDDVIAEADEQVEDKEQDQYQEDVRETEATSMPPLPVEEYTTNYAAQRPATAPPPQHMLPFAEDEEEVSRQKRLMLDLHPHTVVGNCVRSVNNALVEMRRGDIIRSNGGALYAVELAQQLSSTLPIIKALQDRLKRTHGAVVFVTLARFHAVVELIARDLREIRVGRSTAGANAGRCVALSKQIDAMRALQMRLKPSQTAACAHLAWQ